MTSLLILSPEATKTPAPRRSALPRRSFEAFPPPPSTAALRPRYVNPNPSPLPNCVGKHAGAHPKQYAQYHPRAPAVHLGSSTPTRTFPPSTCRLSLPRPTRAQAALPGTTCSASRMRYLSFYVIFSLRLFQSVTVCVFFFFFFDPGSLLRSSATTVAHAGLEFPEYFFTRFHADTYGQEAEGGRD
jgi:hypothetical protein